jgi:hypothetical protein
LALAVGSTAAVNADICDQMHAFPIFFMLLLDTFQFISGLTVTRMSRDTAVGIATGYGLDDSGVEDRVPVGTRIVTFPYRPDWSGAHPVSYPMGSMGSFPEG